MGRRNCNLQLGHPRLVPPSHDKPMMEATSGQLKLLYNGRLGFCDATELRARAIIMHASQGKGKGKGKCAKGEGDDDEAAEALALALALIGCLSPCPAGNGISMKKSLQSFLQNRMHRIQSTSPY